MTSTRTSPFAGQPPSVAPTVAEIADELDYPAMDLDPKTDLPRFADLIDGAMVLHGTLVIGMGMLRKSRDELAAAFKAMTDAADDDGQSVVDVIDQLAVNRDWLAGYAEILDVIHERAVSAAAKMVADVT